jgi:hypothetical protein
VFIGIVVLIVEKSTGNIIGIRGYLKVGQNSSNF